MRIDVSTQARFQVSGETATRLVATRMQGIDNIGKTYDMKARAFICKEGFMSVGLNRGIKENRRMTREAARANGLN
jgi:hypothetical protein